MHWSQSKFIICTVLLHKMLFFSLLLSFKHFLFLVFLSYFDSFTFVMIRSQRIFGIFYLFEIFRHSHGIFQLFFCFIYYFSGHLNPLMYQIHLYAFQRQQNTPHKYFLAGATATAAVTTKFSFFLFPFSICVYNQDPKFIFLFPDACVLRFIFYPYTILFSMDFHTHVRSLFLSLNHLFYMFRKKKKK